MESLRSAKDQKPPGMGFAFFFQPGPSSISPWTPRAIRPLPPAPRWGEAAQEFQPGCICPISLSAWKLRCFPSCRGSSVPKNHRKAATSFQDRAAGGGTEPALSKAQEKGSEALTGPRRNRLEWGTRAHEAQLIIHTPGISEFGVPRRDPVTPGGAGPLSPCPRRAESTSCKTGEETPRRGLHPNYQLILVIFRAFCFPSR